MRIGVLALQGAFIEHERRVAELGAQVFEIRERRDIDAPFDGLVLPGGESTVHGTTTMKEMDAVVKLAKEKNVKAKIIIGGAVITQDYCDEIGADGYSKDAADAVKCAAKLLGLNI